MKKNKNINNLSTKDMINDFCHDFRNPLSIMRMNLDLYELSDDFKKGGKKAEDIVQTLNKEIDVLIKKLEEVSFSFNSLYTLPMAKRLATNTKNKTSRSKKTKKRLEIKRQMLLKKKARA